MQESLEEALDKAIDSYLESGAIPDQEEKLVALAEDMLWGQETELGATVGDILTNWLISKLQTRKDVSRLPS